MDTTEPVPADPIHPTTDQQEPAWVRYVAGTLAYVLILVGARYGLDMEGDEALLASFVSGPVVYAITTWRTRKKVYSPATVAKIVTWQASGHDGEVVTRASQVERPDRPVDLG